MMFWSGVFLTKAVFYLEQKRKRRKFHLLMSVVILQVLDSVYVSHMAAAEYAATELKNVDSIEEKDVEEYLRKEGDKVSVLMDLYTLLLIKATPEGGREYINYGTWKEAHALILKTREVMNHGKNKG
jgi:hypothetical protein